MDDEYYIDPILKNELIKIKKGVTKKDRDFVLVIDGEEGSGKSVLTMQIAKFLDSSFNLENVCFNSTQFIERLKKAPRFSCIVLDEAFNSANSRASLTEVNRSLIGVATEMRQRNLFVLIVIPSFFDLDRYFALWRCKSLIHVYFNKKGGRGKYIIFPKSKKKYLYLTGKKFYDYRKPKSPYPPCSFTNHYTLDEEEYRKKKSEAFKIRETSNLAKRWKGQRDCFIKELYHNYKINSPSIAKILEKWKTKTLSAREIRRIVQLEDTEYKKEG